MVYSLCMISWLSNIFVPTAHAASSAGDVVAAGFAVVFILFIIVFQLVIWGLAIAGLVFWIFMLIDVVQRENWEHENDKTTWILVVVLAGAIGALIYYFSVRRKLGPANKSHHAAAKKDTK